jgi:hypothetical protein
MSKNNINVPNRRTLSSLFYEERVFKNMEVLLFSKYIGMPRTCPDPDPDPGPVNGSGFLQPNIPERNSTLRPVNSRDISSAPFYSYHDDLLLFFTLPVTMPICYLTDLIPILY